MAGPFRLVVARHTEPLDWLNAFPDWDPHIVQKDVDVPNVGREPASFLWGMEQLYRCRGRIAFVQGGPFDHAPNLDQQLDQARAESGFSWLGDPSYVSEAEGAPWHHGLPVKAKLKEWFGIGWDGPVLFAAGGQFVIDAALLRQWPREKYAALRREMAVGEYPWVMERLWKRFLTKE
jgi:hypothetical protein